MAEKSEEGTDPAEERVGYGKPPQHSRFKPGRSGNPRGRPKGAVGCKAILERVVFTQHTVIEHGKHQRRTVLELLLLALRKCAIAGDPRAFSAFHDLIERYGPRDTKTEGAFIFMPEPLSQEEQDQERKRVQDLEQKRGQTWTPRKRR